MSRPPDDDARGELARTQAQLMRYAEDMNRLLADASEKEADLHRTYKQMQFYARDLQKALEAERARREELETAYYDTVVRLMTAASFRDVETGEHIKRISTYVWLISLSLGLSEEEAEQLSAASVLHDIGKIGIDDSILRKPGPLTKDEWAAMTQHTVIGAKILEGSSSRLVQLGREIALSHHERWDGSGYPSGLKREEIPLSGRIVMLADQYDALRSWRPYKPAFTHERTCEIILDGDGRTLPEHFDPRLRNIFREIHPRFEAAWQQLADPHPPIA